MSPKCRSNGVFAEAATQPVLDWAYQISNPSRESFIPKSGISRVLRASGLSGKLADEVGFAHGLDKPTFLAKASVQVLKIFGPNDSGGIACELGDCHCHKR